MKTSDLKTKPAQGHMPWWAEEDDEEDRKREAARQSWMKPKITKQEVKQQEPDAVDNVKLIWMLSLCVCVCFLVGKGYMLLRVFLPCQKNTFSNTGNPGTKTSKIRSHQHISRAILLTCLDPTHYFTPKVPFNVWLQKVSILPPRKVIGNS